MGARAERSRMGDLLLEMGLLDEATLDAALAEQKLSGRRLPRILGEKRVLDEERLTKAVAAKLGLEVVNVSSLKIHERVLALIPAAIALRYGVLPIAIKRANGAEYLYLVMADPLDADAISEVQRVTGRQVRVLMGTATDVDTAIDAQYRAIQGKHVAPMPPATQPPPPQPPPQLVPPAKQPNLQAVRKSDPAIPAPRQVKRPISQGLGVQPLDPATGGPTELVRPALPPLRTHQPTPAPAPAPTRAQPTPVRAAPQPSAPAPQPSPSTSRVTPAPKTPTLATARAPASISPPPSMSAQAARRPSFRLTAQDLDLIQPMPLDEPDDEPRTRIDDPVQADWDLAVRDWTPPASPPPASASALSQRAGEHQIRIEEPVTTEAKLADLDVDHDEPFELVEVEAEEISTSQIELEELSEAQVIAMQAQPVRLAMQPLEMMRAFEIPIDIDDSFHPFEGPTQDDVPTGLERTGIIPAIDWSSEQFEPPPLPESGRPNRALIGGDIPMSKAAVEARLHGTPAPNPRAPGFDFIAALEVPPPAAPVPVLVAPPVAPARPASQRKPALAQAEDSDADAMPVIEPSSLMSLMDFEASQEITGSNDIPKAPESAPPSTLLFDESKKVREDEQTLLDVPGMQIPIEDIEDLEPTPSGDEVDRDAVLLALDGQFSQFSDPIVMEQPVEAMPLVEPTAADDHARGLVRALLLGRSLKSVERAELVLALTRLLIKNGVIDEEELAIELTLDADE